MAREPRDDRWVAERGENHRMSRDNGARSMLSGPHSAHACISLEISYVRRPLVRASSVARTIRATWNYLHLSGKFRTSRLPPLLNYVATLSPVSLTNIFPLFISFFSFGKTPFEKYAEIYGRTDYIFVWIWINQFFNWLNAFGVRLYENGIILLKGY